MLTGWDCPACGGQRALHSLLHGRVGEALHFNPFLVVSVPYFLAVAWTSLDGGRLVFLIIEAIFRRPVPAKYERWVHAGGFALLICLMLAVTFQDIMRIATGG